METQVRTRSTLPALNVLAVDKQSNEEFKNHFPWVKKEDNKFRAELIDGQWNVVARHVLARRWNKKIETSHWKKNIQVRSIKPFELIQLVDREGKPSGVYFDHEDQFWCDRIIIYEVMLDKLPETIYKLCDLGIYSDARNVFQDHYGTFDIVCLFDTPMSWKMHKRIQKEIGPRFYEFNLTKDSCQHGEYDRRHLEICRVGSLTEKMFEVAKIEQTYKGTVLKHVGT